MIEIYQKYVNSNHRIHR